MNKAVFLDRDGTIIEDVGYLSSPEQIKFIPGSIDAIKSLNQSGYKVIVISNQSGVARGHFSEDMLQTVDKVVHRGLLHGGAHVDAHYYCPHHPQHGVYPYKQECDCRKPNTGLVKQAAKKFDIDLKSSFMIGDKATDIELGKRSGVKTAMVRTGYGVKELEKAKDPDKIAENLAEAVKWVLSTLEK
jgi:D-glycero-D-manno-heptose 1,7-bisphosphate phosphatase